MEPNIKKSAAIQSYQEHIKDAVYHFWGTRKNQFNSQAKKDNGTRGAVTGGRQLDGFIHLFEKISLDVGIPADCIYTKNNVLPGYFRSTKNWDFLILSPKNDLLVCIEFKSQVGSFGNNFNNRVEEAIGSSADLWTAFREGVFNKSVIKPWLGYFMIVEKTKTSNSSVKNLETHYPVMEVFKNTSYLDRYRIFCERLIKEKLYDNTALVWTSHVGEKIEYGNINEQISAEAFVHSFAGYLLGKTSLFT